MTKRILPAAAALLAFGAAFALAWLLLMQLGAIIPAAANAFLPDADAASSVGRIFAQFSDAAVSPQWIIAAAAGGALALLRFFCPPKGGAGVFGYVLLGLILWLGTFAGTLLLSRLNGIRVWSIVSSLIDLIRGGILEIL